MCVGKKFTTDQRITEYSILLTVIVEDSRSTLVTSHFVLNKPYNQ